MSTIQNTRSRRDRWIDAAYSTVDEITAPCRRVPESPKRAKAFFLGFRSTLPSANIQTATIGDTRGPAQRNCPAKREDGSRASIGRPEILA